MQRRGEGEGVAGEREKGHHCRLIISNKDVDSRLVKNYPQLQYARSPGVGFDQEWSLTVGDQHVSSSWTTSYTAPQIEALDPSVNTFATEGGDLLTLIGTNFGPVRADNEVSAWYANSALSNLAGTTFNATTCTVITADVEMLCEVAPGVEVGVIAGAGRGRRCPVEVLAPVRRHLLVDQLHRQRLRRAGACKHCRGTTARN